MRTQLKILFIATIIIALVLVLPYFGIHIATTPPASEPGSALVPHGGAQLSVGEQHTAGARSTGPSTAARQPEKSATFRPTPVSDKLSEIEELLR